MNNKKLTKYISFLALISLTSGSGLHAAINVNLGGGTGDNQDTNTNNWYTNNDAATNDGAGLSYNWERVNDNRVQSGSPGYMWTLVLSTHTNYTIGHGFLFNKTFDLSDTLNGIESLDFTLQFDAHDTFGGVVENWRLLMAVDGVQYQYDAEGNYYSGEGVRDFSNLHLSSNWVRINNQSVTTINDTLGVEMTQGLLQGTTGIVQFGFMSWGESSAGNISGGTFRPIRVDQFEVDITYNAVPEPATFALLLGSAGLCFVMIRRRHT